MIGHTAQMGRRPLSEFVSSNRDNVTAELIRRRGTRTAIRGLFFSREIRPVVDVGRPVLLAVAER